jgi:LysR family transcriptional regulator of gallate degradation
LRLLRAAEAVARLGSAARAAGELHLSVSAVSRAVAQAEAALGLALFERAARGMHALPAGTTIALRVRRALLELRQGGGPTLAARATDAMLATVVAVAEARSETVAARRMGVSQPAVHQTLKQLEHAARVRLLQRSRHGMRLTEAGERVLRAAKLALAELRTGLDELQVQHGLSPGRVALGVLPMASDVLVPKALSRLLSGEGRLTVTVSDGTYEALMQDLRHGDLDLVVGPLRGGQAAADLVEHELLVDRLLPVARTGHPLHAAARRRGSRRPTLRTLAAWPWIGPLPGTPARAAFERAFAIEGLGVPAVALQANSPALVRSVLLSGDHVAMLSTLQIHAEMASGLLAVLSVPVQGTARPIGLTLRRDAMPSAATRTLIAALRQVAADLAARQAELATGPWRA